MIGAAFGALKWLVGTETGRVLALVAVLAAGALYLRHDAYTRGRSDALAQARQETRNAINKLAETAEDASAARRLCIAAGGVWEFAAGRCADG